MVIRSAVQSASNMPQRTIFLVFPLTLCAVLAACSCSTVLHRSDRDTVSARSIGCNRGENSTECVTRRRMEEAEGEGREDRSMTRESRIGGEEFEKSEDAAIEQGE